MTTFHDFLVPYLFPKAGPARLAANRLLARTSHTAIFTDLADLELAGPGVCGRVVPIGSNVEREPATEPSRGDVRRLLGVDDATFLVGYFGFLNPSKGVPTLLDAMDRSHAARPDRAVRLALIGAETGVSNPTDLAQARAVHDAIEHAQTGRQCFGPATCRPRALRDAAGLRRHRPAIPRRRLGPAGHPDGRARARPADRQHAPGTEVAVRPGRPPSGLGLARQRPPSATASRSCWCPRTTPMRSRRP